MDSTPMAKNAHNRIIARVAEKCGLSTEECDFIVKAMYKRVRYYLTRPWLIPGDGISIPNAIRFSLNLDLILRYAFWHQKDEYEQETIFSMLDRLILRRPSRKYIRLRNARFSYYHQKVKEGELHEAPKLRKAILAYLFITKQQARKIAFELSSKSLFR